MKRITALLIISVLLTAILISCSSVGKNTVMKVGGNEVSFDEYRYFYMNFRRDHLNRGDSDYKAEIKSEIEAALCQKYAKHNFAEEKSVALVNDDYAVVKQTKQAYIDSYGGIDQFRASITENYLTEELFYHLLCEQTLEEKLREFEYDEFKGDIRSDDNTVEAYIRDNFIHATHILILNEPGDDLVANFNLANDIHQRAVSGENFNSLIAQYNEDSDMEDDPTGYYFVHGQLIAEFEDAACALNIGDISEVVLSQRGYHIIKRLPLDDNYINDNFEELRSLYKVRIFNDMIDERAAQLDVEYTDYYNTITEDMLIEGTDLK